MADVEYSVLAVLGVKDAAKFKGAMNSAASGVGQFASGLAGVASQVAGLGISAVAMAAKVASIGAGAVLAVGGVAAAGMVKNLSMLEDKSIQLSAVIAAATSTPFEQTRVESNKLFEQFRQDAITSAGETKDFVGVAASIAGAMIGAGRSMDELRSATQGVVATAPSLGTSFEQAGNDVMRMFQGHAGVELPFFRAMLSIPALGIKSAEAFNKMGVNKIIDTTVSALRNPAFLAAAAAMGNTFTGLSSTVQDQMKTMGGAIGGPIFEHIKHGMKSFTNMMMPKMDKDSAFSSSLDKTSRSIVHAANQIGDRWGKIFGPSTDIVDKLAIGLERGVGEAISKIQTASNFIADHWGQITDGAHRFGQKLEHAYDVAKHMVEVLGGGDLGKGIERLVGAGVAAKAGSTLAPIAGSGLAAAGGAAQIAKAIGLFGGSTAAAAAAAPEAAGAAGAAVAAAAGGISGGTLAIALAVVAALSIAIVDAWDRNMGDIHHYMGTVLTLLKDSFSSLWTSIVELHAALRPILNIIGTAIIIAVIGFIAVLSLLVNILSGIIKYVARFIDWLLNLDVAFDAIGRHLDQIGESVGILGEAVRFFAEIGKEFYNWAASIGLIKKKLGATEDTTNHTESEVIGSGVAFGKGELKVKAVENKPKPTAGGAGQKIDVHLKIDLSGGENEEAIFIRSGKHIKKALEDGAARARISTSILHGTTT